MSLRLDLGPRLVPMLEAPVWVVRRRHKRDFRVTRVQAIQYLDKAAADPTVIAIFRDPEAARACVKALYVGRTWRPRGALVLVR